MILTEYLKGLAEQGPWIGDLFINGFWCVGSMWRVWIQLTGDSNASEALF